MDAQIKFNSQLLGGRCITSLRWFCEILRFDLMQNDKSKHSCIYLNHTKALLATWLGAPH